MLKITDKIDQLNINQETKNKLISLGWTHIGMCIPQDEEFFAKNLTQDQFIELSVEVSRIRAYKFWNEIRNKKQLEKYLDNE